MARNDEPEVGLVAFLRGDPEVMALLETPPDPPRIFPNVAPQSLKPEQEHLVYEVAATREPATLQGPGGLARATILLECRVKASVPKKARELARRIRHSRGPNPDGSELDGFSGQWPEGYTVQKAGVEDTYYRFEKPVKAMEIGTHVVVMELIVWWLSQ